MDTNKTGKSPKINRVALGLEYDGTNYNGWQIQDHAASIQGSLNQSISKVADETVHCVGAGRTDSGVHASGQVIHFDTHADRVPRSWLLGINSDLDTDINVLWVKAVRPDFHARYSATGRTYRYVILNRPVRSALARSRAWWVRRTLDATAMAVAARNLLGKHDFSSFRASGCQSKTPVREIRRCGVKRFGDWIIFECEANAFLHHMVRNIVGSLATIGRGDAKPEWICAVLEERDRRAAGITAPPMGLTLTHVDYPPEFGIGGL
ncbi:MAG: tRNA pseudouridine(38-40) synthase TruA [Gammaproteobacteria bacterium]|nr:tRNA pseudouridine(38-40) synthase TruA [Gammaproteobacteria bacterium]